jgi:hypothetical protein
VIRCYALQLEWVWKFQVLAACPPGKLLNLTASVFSIRDSATVTGVNTEKIKRDIFQNFDEGSVYMDD